MDVVVWPRTFEECKELLAYDRIIFVQGKVEQDESGPQLFADVVIPLEQAVEKLSRGVCLRVQKDRLDADRLASLTNLVRAHKGECPLYFDVATDNGLRAYLQAGRQFALKPSNTLTTELETIFGEGCVVYRAN